MTSDEFMELITAIRELDHHQRKQMGAALSQQSDEAKVIELIEAFFDTKSACPHCVSTDLYRYGLVSGCNVIFVKNATKPSMHLQARRWPVFARSQNGWITSPRWHNH